ncbi:MAG: hypothetical protein ACRDKT_13425 [Actinomycetota bacterium]
MSDDGYFDVEMAGMRLRDRWTDWDRAPFTSESRRHASIWAKS